MLRLDPFGGGPAIGREQSVFYSVKVEFPARIMADALQPDVNKSVPGNSGEFRHKMFNVFDKKISHSVVRQNVFVEFRM